MGRSQANGCKKSLWEAGGSTPLPFPSCSHLLPEIQIEGELLGVDLGDPSDVEE